MWFGGEKEELLYLEKSVFFRKCRIVGFVNMVYFLVLNIGIRLRWNVIYKLSFYIIVFLKFKVKGGVVV